MTSSLPPSRYKIVERDRRLVTIDTWTGEEAGPKTNPDTARPAAKSVASPVWTGMQSGKAANPLDQLIATFAKIATQDRFDEAGRPILKTSKIYDLQGPRDIALDGPGTRRVGQVALASAVLLLLLLVLFVVGTEMFFVAIALLVFGGRVIAKPALTAIMVPVLSGAAEPLRQAPPPLTGGAGPWSKR